MEKKYYMNDCSVHKVNGVENIFESEDEYILYHPYKHYWIIINSTGCEILEAVNKYVTYMDIKAYFEKKYSFDTEFDFENDVEYFLDYLVQKGFLTNEKFDAPHWTKIIPDAGDITKYKFNEIYISVDDVCNLNCIYCFNKVNRHNRIRRAQEEILSVDKICSVLKEFKELGGHTVVFTGGEPTLYPHFLELMQEVSKIGLKIQIITNGTTLSRISIEEFLGYLDVINISIDSVESEELAVLWGKSNGEKELKNLFEGLERLRAEVKKEGVFTRINIMPVVTRVNIGSMFNLVRTLNAFFDRNLLWKFSMYGDIGIEEIDERLRISESEYYQLLFELAKELDIKNDILAQQAYAINFGNTKKLLPYPRTSSCAPSFLITATGEVFPCQGLEMEENFLGNIYEYSLRELFFGKRFTEIRNQLIMSERNECFMCELKYVCTERCSICRKEKKCRENCKDAVIRRMYYKVKGY